MTTPDTTSAAPAQDENHIIAERRAKLTALRVSAEKAGTHAFPNDFRREHLAGDLADAYGEK